MRILIVIFLVLASFGVKAQGPFPLFGNKGWNLGITNKLYALNATDTIFSFWHSKLKAYRTVEFNAGTATAGTAPLKFVPGTILTIAESGALETDGGNNIFYTNATAIRGRLQQNRTLTSAAGTLSVTDNYNHYIFTGSTSTWTLPSVSGTANVIYYIKNRGSGVLTINTTSGNEIYDSAAVATINVSAGAALVLFSDGTYYNVE